MSTVLGTGLDRKNLLLRYESNCGKVGSVKSRQKLPYEDWSPCSPGTLQELQRRIRRQRQRERAIRIGAPILFLGIVVLGSWGLHWSKQPTDTHPGGLACHEVQPYLPRYVKGELSSRLERAVATHLDHCPRCRKQMHAMEDHSVTNRLPSNSHQLPGVPNRGLAALTAPNQPWLRGSPSGN